ncbi:FHA domain-containing protein [candidate division KSB1 bacterium]|nr:FHA domain-containing protein [candidate division KSB1 bacterium]
MPTLQITKDGFLLQELEIQAESMTIGRDPENEVRLGDLTVSRRHALLTRHADNRYFIEDLQSRNGVSLNGSAVTQPMALTGGDQIRVGIYQLIFLDSAEVTQFRQSHVEKAAPETLPAASHPTKLQSVEESNAAKHRGHALEIGVLVNEDSNAIFALKDDQIVLGNDGQVDIRVPGPERTRATIARRGKYFYICSETPTPCVSVNGRPVMNSQLAYNDRIEIGGRRFIFREI